MIWVDKLAEREYFVYMISRKLKDRILGQLRNEDLPRGVIIYGPRQVGKTTLVKMILHDLGEKVLMVSGDSESEVRRVLESRDWAKIRLVLAGYQVLVIDEAQRIKEVGLIAKIVLDSSPRTKVILTGSASLDLASKINEPLTGRAYSYRLWPISQGELVGIQTYAERLTSLEERVIYGSYPRLVTLENLTDKREYLTQLVDKYLYKDVLEYGGMRNADKLRSLLKLLAYQVGSQVSVAELAGQLEMSRETVNRYLDLLESSFIIFRLPGYSRNLRNEMKKMKKVYFWDTGVRNVLVNSFEWKRERIDWGQLWENWVIAERMKRGEYERRLVSYYFWRLKSGAELDLIEESEGRLLGVEIKAGEKNPKAPASWLAGYPEAEYRVVNRDNWNEFVVR